MSYNGTEGNAISPATAADWTRSYRDANPGQVKAYFAGREVLQRILDQPDCQGIRLYYGLDGGIPKLVAVGADSQENDQLDNGCIVADDFSSCPAHCGQPSILNS